MFEPRLSEQTISPTRFCRDSILARFIIKYNQFITILKLSRPLNAEKMRQILNALLSRSVRSCLDLLDFDRTRENKVVLSIEPAFDDFGEVLDEYVIAVADDGRPFPQDHKLIKSFLKSVFQEEDTEILNRGVVLCTAVLDGASNDRVDAKRNPVNDQLQLSSKRVTSRKKETFSCKLSFTATCTNSDLLLGKVRFSDFFIIAHEIIDRVVLLAPGVEMALHIKGEKLAYLYRGLSLPASLEKDSSVVMVERQDLGREMRICLRTNIHLQRTTELTVFVQHLMHSQQNDELKERAQELPIADAAGLLDDKVLHEVQKYHPVNLMKTNRNPMEEVNASDRWVGVCLCKSDRVWKSGRLNALCGISASSQNQCGLCKLHLYDHHGIMDRGAETVYSAFQRSHHAILYDACCNPVL